jgi:hypothetical protein
MAELEQEGWLVKGIAIMIVTQSQPPERKQSAKIKKCLRKASE